MTRADLYSTQTSKSAIITFVNTQSITENKKNEP